MCSQDSLSMTFDQGKATSDMVALCTLDSDTQHGYIVGSSMVLILGLKWLHMCIMPPFCTCRIVFDMRLVTYQSEHFLYSRCFVWVSTEVLTVGCRQ